MNRRAAVACLALLAAFAVPAVTAQPYPLDMYVANMRVTQGGAIGDIMRLNSAGKLATLIPWGKFSPSYPNMIMMDNNNRDLVVLEPSRISIWDMSIRKPIATIAGPSGMTMNWILPHPSGDFVIVGPIAGHGFVLRLPRTGGSPITLASGAPLFNLQSAAIDLTTGGYILGVATPHDVLRVAPDGTLITTHSIRTRSAPFALAQDHRTGTIVVGTGMGYSNLGGDILTIDSAGKLGVIFCGAGNANAVAFDRDAGLGEIVIGTNPIYRVTVGGVFVTTYPGPATPWCANTGLCFAGGRNLVCTQTASPNAYRFDLHIPEQIGRYYVLGLSMSGFTPGIPIQKRTVQLVPDPLFVLTVQGKLPFFTGNIGTLSTSGRAAAHLDLRRFGKALKGLKIWAAAVTVEPRPPYYVGVVTKPIVLVLE